MGYLSGDAIDGGDGVCYRVELEVEPYLLLAVAVVLAEPLDHKGLQRAPLCHHGGDQRGDDWPVLFPQHRPAVASSELIGRESPEAIGGVGDGGEVASEVEGVEDVLLVLHKVLVAFALLRELPDPQQIVTDVLLHDKHLVHDSTPDLHRGVHLGIKPLHVSTRQQSSVHRIIELEVI